MGTIEINTWGRSGIGVIRVRATDDENVAAAACRSIARRTGLSVATCRSDGTSLDNRGRPESHHYQCTLGKRLRSGGYSVEGEIWFAVPVRSSNRAITDARGAWERARIARDLAYGHDDSPEVCAAGGSSASDADEFDATTLQRALREAGLATDDDAVYSLREALRSELRGLEVRS